MPFQGPGGDSGSLYPSKTSIPSASKANSSAGGEVGSPGYGKNINTRGFARSTSLPSPVEQKNIQNPRARHPKLMVNPRNPSNNSNNTDNNSKGGASNNDSKSSGLPRTSSLPADYKRAVPPRASTVSKSSKTPTRQRSSASANNSSANASGNFRASSPRGNLSRRQQFLSRHNNLGKAENSRAGSSRSSRPTSPRDEKGVSATGRQQQQQFERHVTQLDDGARSDGVGMLLDGRDEEAKARRLCRFNTELNRQPGLTQTDLSPLTSNRSSQPQRSKALQDAAESMDYEDFDALPDRDCAMAEAILGSCQEMCPESEREERERTGDIDKFERLDGNGNQPDCYLLVKKYNRGAEREACLIRPLPVLRKTMEHLTNLMNCAYDEDFLSLYNFLWDRMRAIRMDMRMQHIFNQDTIRMHEQMIRFHIVAMHELCESAKGEGFSEEFDAHLNIEQMNKTSVELFQMYDDHRKRGILAPSEAEFRGYYALLKLDKHPGHMVEPAELSLDLSKMTPEIRNTSEVLFARQVARASRSTNFIQFFRHARKATYLQSCLMHAHFTKLRTQALASLYSALQKNQGVPVSQLVKWLAMEGEDMEALLTYHGFSLKQYEEAYMVKEGPFLNRDNDFPTKRSQLVYNKRSSRVFDDVISSRHVPIIDATFYTLKATDGATDRCINMHKATNTPDVTATLPSEEEMPDYEDELHGATYRCINMHKATNTLDVTATLPSEEEMPDYEYQLQPPHCEVKEWKINQQLGGSVDKQMHSLKEACEVPSLTGAPLDKRMPSVKGSCEVPILSVAPLDKRMLPVKGSCEVPILSVAPLDKGMPSVKEACQVPILTVAPLDKDMPSVQEACQVPIPTVTPPATEMLSVGKACEAPMATVKPTFGVQNITYLFKAEMTDVISKNNFQQKEQPCHKRKSYFSPGTARQHRRRIGEVEEDLKAAENNDFIPKTFSCYDKRENDVARDTSQHIIAECKQREEEERLALYWKQIQLIRLKLLLRRWKRQAAKKRKERHLNHLESGYALSSLCLGRPVQPNKLVSPGEQLISGIPRQPVPAKALTWEQIFRERQSRHERMWSKLQLPELIAPILREKNPQAKCLCWKLIICSRTRDNDGHDKQRHTHRTNTASQWLLAKLIGNGRTNDEVLLSSPDMVIMKKQLNIACEHSGSHDLFFLSIVKDLSFNIETVEREDACLGASGIIFLLLEDVQWDIERARLRSLVNTVPSGSKLPLLIICSKNCEESRPQNQQVIGSMQAKIERELEVLCLDRTKIGSLSIISITEIEGGVARGGFFSDECLRDGLLWLANEAPVQPVVYPSDLRGLVQEYLNNYFVVLNKKPAEVRPDHCIHAFNESLDRTAHDISKTAQNSHPHWPPPEIRLLDKTTENRILVNSFLPNPGWNIASNIYSILQVLQVCRLPHFPALNSNYIFCGTQEQGVSSSGLNPGRTEWDEIQKLKSCFKKLLDEYLKQIGFIRENDMMSLKEADIMLQKGAVFEHSGLRYAIIPKWATIFQRIFSWRLMLLASEPPLVVYVSQPHSTASSGFEQKQQLASGHQVFLGSSYAQQGPSLDEMVRLSIPCNPTMTPNNPMVGDQFMEKLKELNLESTAEAGDIYLLEKENYSRHVHDVVQEEITSNERYPDVELSQTSLEFPPTEEELHLDDVVKKYCAKVDEQMRWTQMEAERAKGSMHPALIEEARSPIAQNEFLTQVADKSCPELSNDSQYLPSWADDNGMETLNRLVEQCDNVQRTIDKIYSSGN